MAIISRRRMLGLSAMSVLGLGVANSAKSADQGSRPSMPRRSAGDKPLAPVSPGRGYSPVAVPNGAALPFKIIDGVKVFHVIAEEIDHEFDPALKAKCWGYNGRVNGTIIEAVEGERVRIYVTNRLPVATSIHWHGVILPNGMDGAAGLTQPYIKSGETGKYEFTLRQHGTQMFHSHHDEMSQMGLGLIGNFVIHPRNPTAQYRVDRDFSLLLSEWRIDAGTFRPNPLEMTDFNILTINGKVFPSAFPLICKTGDKVRLRFGNLSATDHHPLHIHGHHVRITATDGGDIPASAQWPETTVLVGVGQTRNVEFIADAPGDWPLHCHMTHHTMNQMGHRIPNTVGMKAEGLEDKLRPILPSYMNMGQNGMDMGKMAETMPYPRNTIAMKGITGPFGDYFSMGGMFTLIKIRDHLQSYDKDPGWYEHPAGTVALLATNDDLSRDGIKADR